MESSRDIAPAASHEHSQPASDVSAQFAVAVENVSKEFRTGRSSRSAVQQINMHIPRGQIVAIVGPTGCGKTTLLNLIAGFERPTSGRVLVDAAVIDRPSPVCGYVPQQANLFPWLTVLDNILFGARYGRGIRRDWHTIKELRAEADEYLGRLGLADARNLYPYQISGGMRARAAIGRVLLANTQVLLMDEPFASLDALTRSSLHRLLLEQLAQDDDRTMVLITHDIEEALLLSQEIYLMSPAPGKIIRKMRVSFGWPRDYEQIVGSPDLARQRRVIFDELRPFLDAHNG